MDNNLDHNSYYYNTNNFEFNQIYLYKNLLSKNNNFFYKYCFFLQKQLYNRRFRKWLSSRQNKKGSLSKKKFIKTKYLSRQFMEFEKQQQQLYSASRHVNNLIKLNKKNTNKAKKKILSRFVLFYFKSKQFKYRVFNNQLNTQSQLWMHKYLNVLLKKVRLKKRKDMQFLNLFSKKKNKFKFPRKFKFVFPSIKQFVFKYNNLIFKSILKRILKKLQRSKLYLLLHFYKIMPFLRSLENFQHKFRIKQSYFYLLRNLKNQITKRSRVRLTPSFKGYLQRKKKRMHKLKRQKKKNEMLHFNFKVPILIKTPFKTTIKRYFKKKTLFKLNFLRKVKKRRSFNFIFNELLVFRRKFYKIYILMLKYRFYSLHLKQKRTKRVIIGNLNKMLGSIFRINIDLYDVYFQMQLNL